MGRKVGVSVAAVVRDLVLFREGPSKLSTSRDMPHYIHTHEIHIHIHVAT